MSMSVLWLGMIFLASAAMTGMLRKYALARNILDQPNHRSSHTVSTPRGGGMAIVVSFLMALTASWAMSSASSAELVAFAGAGVLIAATGFIDDHGHVPARWRLVAHFVAAGWGLAWLGGLTEIEWNGAYLDWGYAGGIITLLGLIWMLNLYNFMDGIDGIASIEAISVCLAACVIYLVKGQLQLIPLPLMLASATGGFLLWNFPPAKIFMGDAGSGFLGLCLGLICIQAGNADPHLLWVWLVLLGCFIVDATTTLIRRLCRGDKVYEAHRLHAYQFASRKYGRHSLVTLGVLMINVLWLFPIAYAMVEFNLNSLLGVAVAYVPLVALALWHRAGALEQPQQGLLPK